MNGATGSERTHDSYHADGRERARPRRRVAGMMLPSARTMPQPLTIPMDDGVQLAGLRWPAAATRAPAIVMLTPYRKEGAPEAILSVGRDLGCNVVSVDLRGLGGSEGEWDGPFSPREVRDGVSVLEWVADSEFCDGRTAVVGPSYLGMMSLWTAAGRPHGLRCAIASVPPVDFYRDLWHRGGIPSHTSWGAVVAAVHQHRPEMARRVLDDFYGRTAVDAFDDLRCAERSVESRIVDIEVPTLVAGGWSDYFRRATVRAYNALRAPRRLVIGNWHHDDLATVRRDEVERWLTRWLLGLDKIVRPERSALLQDPATGRWTGIDDWPDPSSIVFEQWRLVGEPAVLPVLLAFDEIPEADEIQVAPTYDAATGSGMHQWGPSWTVNWGPPPTATVLLGPVALRAILVSEDATDLDLHARLTLREADGSLRALAEGRLRASHRALTLSRSTVNASGDVVVPWHPHDAAEAIPLRTPIDLLVEIDPIYVQLRPGASLRLGITLIRADRRVRPAIARLLPESHLLLPRRAEGSLKRGAAAGAR
jgi:predicted acyl esterase